MEKEKERERLDGRRRWSSEERRSGEEGLRKDWSGNEEGKNEK